MVLQNASSHRQVPFQLSRLELDPSRIVAISGALLLNLAVLLLLLVPAGMPQFVPASRDKIIEIFDILPVKPVVKDPVTATPEPTTKTDSKPRTPTVSPPAPTPILTEPVVVPEGTLPAEPVTVAPTTSPAIDVIAPSTGPVAGAQLEYVSASAPPYPREALLAGIQGTVMLKVLVGVDGRPIQVDISTSSGNRKLDEVARRHVLRNWIFRPAMQDGRAVEAIGLVPIDFKLDR